MEDESAGHFELDFPVPRQTSSKSPILLNRFDWVRASRTNPLLRKKIDAISEQREADHLRKNCAF